MFSVNKITNLKLKLEFHFIHLNLNYLTFIFIYKKNNQYSKSVKNQKEKGMKN